MYKVILVAFFLFPGTLFAYDVSTVFCVENFGNADVNGTYTSGAPSWAGLPTWNNGNNGFLSGNDWTFSAWSVIVYPVTPPSGTFSDAQAYLGGAGGLSGWVTDSGNGNTSPAGTVSLGSCATPPTATSTVATSTATTSDISFLLGIFLVLAFYAFIAYLYRTFFYTKSAV